MPQKNVIKGTVAKLQGTDVFHLEPAERKHRGGWVERDGRKKKSPDRQERRSGAGREGDERSENRKGGGERRNQEDQRGASDTERAARPLFAGVVTSTMRIQGKPSNSGCSSSPGQGRPGWVWAHRGPGSQDWGVEDRAVGGHRAMRLLLQPRPAVWGAPCWVKQLPRDAEARKKGCIAAPRAVGLCVGQGPRPGGWACQGLSVKWPGALTSLALFCVIWFPA